jgi:hypothetical protein
MTSSKQFTPLVINIVAGGLQFLAILHLFGLKMFPFKRSGKHNDKNNFI